MCHFDLGGALLWHFVLAGWDRGTRLRHQRPGHRPDRDIVREVANIPEDQVIMTCVAMGSSRRFGSFAAIAVKSDREPNSDFVHYVGFGD